MGRPIHENVYGYFWSQPVDSHWFEIHSKAFLEYRGTVSEFVDSERVTVRASVSMTNFMVLESGETSLLNPEPATFAFGGVLSAPLSLVVNPPF